MPDKKTVGERLRELRKAAGLSQQELADYVGVDRSTICMYELGQRIPKDDIKIRLCEKLGQDVQYIFFTK